MYKFIQLIFLSLFLLFIHIGAVLAFTNYFSLNLMLIAILLWQLFGTIGISVCYHRELTHRAFKSHPIIRVIHLTLASLAGQAGPILWCTVHRTHHKYSDTEKDIHSPLEGFWKPHLGWLFQQDKRKKMEEFINPPKDLFNDPTLVLFQKLFAPLLLMTFIALY